MACADCLEDRRILARHLCSRCYRLRRQTTGLDFSPLIRTVSMPLEGETWMPWPRASAYEVSDFGRARPSTRDVILKPRWDRSGYLSVCLRLNKRSFSIAVHRLVLETFVGLRPEGLVGCHYDDDKSNNYLTNLRWDTQASNIADAIRNDRLRPPPKKERCKRGHRLTERNSVANRVCRSCRNAYQYLRNHPPVGDYELAFQEEADRFYVTMGMAA